MAEKFDWKIFGASIAGAALGVVGTLWAAQTDYWSKDRGQDIEMVRIALSILSGENKDTSIYGRRYALSMLNKYAVEIKPDEAEAWAKNGTIPDIEWLSNPDRVRTLGKIEKMRSDMERLIERQKTDTP